MVSKKKKKKIETPFSIDNKKCLCGGKKADKPENKVGAKTDKNNGNFKK